MKNKIYLILLVFFLVSCGEERNNQKELPISTKYTPIKEEELAKDLNVSNNIIPFVPIEHHYQFKDLKEQKNTLHIINDLYDFRNIKQPIVIMNIMATWCPPCRGQIPHLSKLQQEFKENVFVMATLVYDDISKEKLDKFIIAQKMLFYVAINQEENLKFTEMLTPKLGLDKDFPMPLTVVFVRGKYFTHYEGMIPEEMIESDIKQLLQKINN
jgi:thiol-disulfide isomerase/thioredoxin